MSRFVDPRHGSRQKPRSLEEQDLIQQAAVYANEQKQKTVKWFTCHGVPLPSDVQVCSLTDSRFEEAARIARNKRHDDRQRLDSPQYEQQVIVPTSKHPLYMDEPADQTPQYSGVAANGMQGRRHLFGSVEQLCRIIMLRNRCDARLSLLSKKARTANSNINASMDIPQLKLLEMPLLYSADVVVGPPPSRKVDPSDAEVRLYPQKELKVPFEFKNRSYRPVKFSDHQFANADLPERVPVLFAGVHEVPVDHAVDAVVPQVEHFVQPLVTLETFPMPQFAFVTPEPWLRTIQSQLPQRLTDGGFREVHQSLEFGRLGPSTVVHSDPISCDVLHRSLPQPLLTHKLAEDALSDSDDEELLPTTLPTGLASVKQWLPQLDAAHEALPSLEDRHVSENEACRIRRHALQAYAAKFKGDMPPDLQLQL